MSAVLFVREDLLKASHYKTITVPGHVHGGNWVSPYQKKVLVSDDHNDLNVASGYGSFYQKQAHKKLSTELDHFNTMHPEEKAAVRQRIGCGVWLQVIHARWQGAHSSAVFRHAERLDVGPGRCGGCLLDGHRRKPVHEAAVCGFCQSQPNQRKNQ